MRFMRSHIHGGRIKQPTLSLSLLVSISLATHLFPFKLSVAHPTTWVFVFVWNVCNANNVD